jgi:hypothetical protein
MRKRPIVTLSILAAIGGIFIYTDSIHAQEPDIQDLYDRCATHNNGGVSTGTCHALADLYIDTQGQEWDQNDNRFDI